MAIKNIVSSDFYQRSSIVKDVFDCHLSSVNLVTKDFETLITGYAIILGVRYSLGLNVMKYCFYGFN